MKQKTIILVDGENISANNAERIITISNRLGRAYLKRTDVGTVCVVTSDGGFHCLAKDAAAAGKKLCFIGGKQASRSLRNTEAHFIELC